MAKKRPKPEELALPFEAITAEKVGQRADVIITITSAFEPLLRADWIRPGTHIPCMGSGSKGKQEVAPVLFAQATVFLKSRNPLRLVRHNMRSVPACGTKAP